MTERAGPKRFAPVHMGSGVWACEHQVERLPTEQQR